jgi:hypothetical protein
LLISDVCIHATDIYTPLNTVKANREGQEGRKQRESLRELLEDPEEMETLQRFMGTSVTAGTMATYRRDWKTWVEFVKEKGQGVESDPYLRNQGDQVKILMVCHLLAKRKGEGKREKAASAITAGIRKHFATAMCSTE